jgi:hypothetical protein
MDADQLSSKTVSLLGEISAVSSRDLWTWQGLIAAGCMISPEMGSSVLRGTRLNFTRTAKTGMSLI